MPAALLFEMLSAFAIVTPKRFTVAPVSCDAKKGNVLVGSALRAH
jgi:hypothetical protein